jgi:23S rRNA (adenine2503-C2)-methyltransferase
MAAAPAPADAGAPVERLVLARRLRSADAGTVKHVWTLRDGQAVESVYVRFPTRDTLCISSQVGCALRCAFCATGLDGWRRDLSAGEIAAQVESALADLGAPRRPFGVTFMGMGEPLLNLPAVLGALRYLEGRHPDALFSLSTVGIVPGLHELAARTTRVHLQLSLHAPDDRLRRRLMPITHRYPIRDALAAALRYAAAAGKTLTVNYLLLEGVNDSDAHARELARVLRGAPVRLKLSRFNPVAGVDLAPAREERHRAFEDACRGEGLAAYEFDSLGVDVEGGCGQLRGRTT